MSDSANWCVLVFYLISELKCTGGELNLYLKSYLADTWVDPNFPARMFLPINSRTSDIVWSRIHLFKTVFHLYFTISEIPFDFYMTIWNMYRRENEINSPTWGLQEKQVKTHKISELKFLITGYSWLYSTKVVPGLLQNQCLIEHWVFVFITTSAPDKLVSDWFQESTYFKWH